MVMEMSKTYQYRKVMKPLLERKRRARINKCLDDLKDLMVECLQQEGEHVTRLEKADILELTVEHMRKLKQRGSLSLQNHQTPIPHIESFRSGYVHAADQITQVLLQQQQRANENFSTDDIGPKIMKFLSTRLIEMQHQQLLRTAAAATAGATTPTTSSPMITVTTTPPLSSTPLPTAIPLQIHFSPSPNLSNYPPVAMTMPIYNGGSNSRKCRNFEKDYRDEANDGLGVNNICLNGGDMIDVTTIDTTSDSVSIVSVDSTTSSSESVWRPW